MYRLVIYYRKQGKRTMLDVRECTKSMQESMRFAMHLLRAYSIADEIEIYCPSEPSFCFIVKRMIMS
jgi:hypothetical protein